MISFKKSFVVLFCLGVLLFGIQQKTQLVIASSPSLPWKVYLVLKGSSWKKGDIVTIKGHSSVYIEGAPLLTKRVVGSEGDRIDQQGAGIYVEKRLIGLLLPHNSKGQPLYAIAFHRIPAGYVFVAGDDPRSFDSRYEEFGLVKVEHIVGRSLPLW